MPTTLDFRCYLAASEADGTFISTCVRESALRRVIVVNYDFTYKLKHNLKSDYPLGNRGNKKGNHYALVINKLCLTLARDFIGNVKKMFHRAS